jgi:hypothetical protein
LVKQEFKVPPAHRERRELTVRRAYRVSPGFKGTLARAEKPEAKGLPGSKVKRELVARPDYKATQGNKATRAFKARRGYVEKPG